MANTTNVFTPKTHLQKCLNAWRHCASPKRFLVVTLKHCTLKYVCYLIFVQGNIINSGNLFHTALLTVQKCLFSYLHKNAIFCYKIDLLPSNSRIFSALLIFFSLAKGLLFENYLSQKWGVGVKREVLPGVKSRNKF